MFNNYYFINNRKLQKSLLHNNLNKYTHINDIRKINQEYNSDPG